MDKLLGISWRGFLLLVGLCALMGYVTTMDCTEIGLYPVGTTYEKIKNEEVNREELDRLKEYFR